MEETKNQQDGGNKVRKKFEESTKKLTAIMGNPHWFKQPKIGQAELPELLERLTLGKKEELYKKFETMAIALVEKKIAYDKAVKQKEKEFNDAVEAKMKEFQGDMDALFAIIDQIDNITKDYFAAFTSVAEGKPPVVMGDQTPGEEKV